MRTSGRLWPAKTLRELHGLDLSKEAIRKLMSDLGLWVLRSQRPAWIYQPRNRRHCSCELVQIDGSDHRWFEDQAPACTLLVFGDDATSQILQLHFTPSESTFSYFEATRAYIEQHSKPQAFYSDKASVFRVNHKHATGGNAICSMAERYLNSTSKASVPIPARPRAA